MGVLNIMKLKFKFMVFLLALFLPMSISQMTFGCEIDLTTTGVGFTPAEYVDRVEASGCEKGNQIFLNLIHDRSVRYIVHNICDLRFSVFIDRTEHDFEGKYDEQDKWKYRNNGVVCIYRGKWLHGNVYE